MMLIAVIDVIMANHSLELFQSFMISLWLTNLEAKITTLIGKPAINSGFHRVSLSLPQRELFAAWPWPTPTSQPP